MTWEPDAETEQYQNLSEREKAMQAIIKDLVGQLRAERERVKELEGALLTTRGRVLNKALWNGNLNPQNEEACIVDDIDSLLSREA